MKEHLGFFTGIAVLFVMLASSMTLPKADTGDYQLLGKSVTRNFDNARRAVDEIYKDHQFELYANCDLIGRDLTIKYSGCSYKPRNVGDTSKITNYDAEHVAAASWMFDIAKCDLTENRREGCLSQDPNYKRYYTDLHNLFPSIPEINRDRGDRRWCETGGGFTYGSSGFRITFKENGVEGCVEPPDRVKGDIARVVMYMADEYGIPVDDKEKRMFNRWMTKDPVDKWEREKNKKVAGIQGNNNKYVK